MSSETGRAVIAGASSGIGAATARRLAADGFDVHLIARREQPLQELAAELGGSYATADTSVPEDLEAALDPLDSPVRVAVYAAGTLAESAVAGHPLELWERTIAVNLTGAFLFARAIVDRLEPGSRLVFISSVTATKGPARLSAYAASKSGVERLAESLSSELEDRGVGVHVVAPGPVATPMLDVPGTSPFQLEPAQVADVVAYLTSLPGDVVLRHATVRAPIKGPFAQPRHDPSG